MSTQASRLEIVRAALVALRDALAADGDGHNGIVIVTASGSGLMVNTLGMPDDVVPKALRAALEVTGGPSIFEGDIERVQPVRH